MSESVGQGVVVERTLTQRDFLKLLSLPFPVITRVQGFVTGGSCGFVFASGPTTPILRPTTSMSALRRTAVGQPSCQSGSAERAHAGYSF